VCVICMLTGGRGASIIHRGTAHAETVDGDTGDDHIEGRRGNDTLSGDLGNDTLSGGRDEDVLDAGGGNDLLLGGDGNDIISGGAGNDRMDGGAGADTYLFSEADWAEGFTRDVIGDFGEGDMIDFAASGDFTFIGEDDFTGAGNEVSVRYHEKGFAVVMVDQDGDGAADSRIVVHTSTDLTAADFAL